MDWTLADNMVNGLFFCATLTSHRRGNTPFVEARAETSGTGAEAVKSDPGSSWKGHSRGWVLMSGMKVWSLVVFSYHSTLHRWSAQSAARLLMSDELMSCYVVGTNGCVDLRCCAFALDGHVRAEWSRCPGSMARHATDSVASLQWSSAGWMPAWFGRLSAGVGRRHPVTICKASLMAGSMRHVWALRHQTGAQYSAVEWTRAKVAVRQSYCPSTPARASKPPQERDGWYQLFAKFLKVSAIRERTCPTLLQGIWALSKRAGFCFCSYFQLTFSFLIVEMEDYWLTLFL